MHTWIGYHHISAQGRGFKGEQYNVVMRWAINALIFYAPFVDDVDNELGNPNYKEEK